MVNLKQLASQATPSTESGSIRETILCVLNFIRTSTFFDCLHNKKNKEINMRQLPNMVFLLRLDSHDAKL